MSYLGKTLIAFTATLPLVAVAAPTAGDQEITLSGAGTSDKDFDSSIFSVQGSWGNYLTDSSLWGIRQTVDISDSDDESTSFGGSTRVFYDYLFGSGAARPFVGASLGGVYGEHVADSFMAGPEVGLKYWVQNNVFIAGMVEYQFLFESGSEARDRYDDGALFYSLGIGYNF